MSELHAAIASIAGKSELADAIIQRRFGDMVSESASSTMEMDSEDYDAILDDVLTDQYKEKGDKAVRQLLTVILNLTEQIAELNESKDDDKPSEPVDEEETQKQVEAFRSTLQGSRVGDLRCYYTKALLGQMKKDTRYLVAKVLVEYAVDLKKEPAPLWSSLVQNNGAM